MKTIKVKDSNGVTHNYNPKYIKDIQEVENHHNNEWCINIILDGEGEHINSILCKSKEEMEALRDTLIFCMESA